MLLAEPTPGSRLGNLAADYIGQRDVPGLPEDVRRGVHQHRQVDAFTDRHPVVFRGMARLPERWGWFKGILLDVYYDHLLALRWPDHCPVPLPQFVFEVNADLLAGAGGVPETAAGSVRRRYRPTHTIGHLQFVECGALDPKGQPVQDLVPCGSVYFPYTAELAERGDLATLPVERRDRVGDEIAETYTYATDGTISVHIQNLSQGYARAFELGALR